MDEYTFYDRQIKPRRQPVSYRQEYRSPKEVYYSAPRDEAGLEEPLVGPSTLGLHKALPMVGMALGPIARQLGAGRRGAELGGFRGLAPTRGPASEFPMRDHVMDVDAMNDLAARLEAGDAQATWMLSQLSPAQQKPIADIMNANLLQRFERRHPDTN